MHNIHVSPYLYQLFLFSQYAFDTLLLNVPTNSMSYIKRTYKCIYSLVVYSREDIYIGIVHRVPSVLNQSRIYSFLLNKY